MFRKNFQGGTSVMVFSPINKDLLSNWIIPRCAKKEYDKKAKTYVYAVQNASAPQYLSVPKDRKMSLGLTQPYLVLQVHLQDSQAFSVQIRSSCASGSRKRVLFSTVQSSIKQSVLFSVVPLRIPHRYGWIHVCISIADVIDEIWNEDYKSIESIDIGGTFRLRLVYTLNENVIKYEEDWVRRYMEKIPKQCVFPQNVSQDFLMISKEYLRQKEEAGCRVPSNYSLSAQLESARNIRSSSSFAGSEKSHMSNRTFTKEPTKVTASDMLECSKEKIIDGLFAQYPKVTQFSHKARNVFKDEKGTSESQMTFHDANSSAESLSSSSNIEKGNQGISLLQSKISLWLPSFPIVPLYAVRDLLKSKSDGQIAANDENFREVCPETVFNMEDWMSSLESPESDNGRDTRT